MERKDYAERIMNVKNDILVEIRKILGYNAKHDFNEPFFIHYVEGEVATTEECVRIEIDNDGKVIVVYRMLGDFEIFATEGDAVLHYSCDSFIDFIENLKKDVHEKKLSHLRDIVAKNGNKISFDGYFWYKPLLDGEVYNTKLIGLSLNSERVLVIENITKGETFSDSENTITDENLDRIIEYVESQVKRKFVIRVSGSFSRTFDIEASTYEKALAEAKKDWEINPLCFDDSNNETWADYTSVAH